MLLPGCDSGLALDNNEDGEYHKGLSCIQTSKKENQTWALDLGRKYQVSKVYIYARTDEATQSLALAEVWLDDFRCGTIQKGSTKSQDNKIVIKCSYRMGQHITIKKRYGGFGLCEVKVFGVDFEKLVSQGKMTTQSSTLHGGSAEKAVDSSTDGDFTKGSCTHTKAAKGNWWEVDLGSPKKVTKVVLWNRQDCCASNLRNSKVTISTIDGKQRLCGWVSKTQPHSKYEIACSSQVGRKVRVTQTADASMSLCEVQVFVDDSSPAAQKMCQAEFGLRIATRSWLLANTLRSAEAKSLGSLKSLNADKRRLGRFKIDIENAKKQISGVFRENELKGREGNVLRKVKKMYGKLWAAQKNMRKVYRDVNAFKTLALKSASYATVIYRLGRAKSCGTQDKSAACVMESRGRKWSESQFTRECNQPMLSYKVTLNETQTVTRQICPETRVPFSRLTTCLDLTKRPKIEEKNGTLVWESRPTYDGKTKGAAKKVKYSKMHKYEVGPKSGTEYRGWYMIPLNPSKLKYWIGARVALDRKYWMTTNTTVSWLDIVNQNNRNDYVTCTLLNGGHRKLKDSFEDYFVNCASACTHASVDMCSSTQCIVNQLMKKGKFSSKVMSMCNKKAEALIKAFDVFLDRSSFDALQSESEWLAKKLSPSKLKNKLRLILRQDNKQAARMYLQNAFLQYKTAFKTSRNLRQQVCPHKTRINLDFPTMDRFLNVIPTMLAARGKDVSAGPKALLRELKRKWKTNEKKKALNGLWNERPEWIFRVLEFRQELVNQQNAFSLAAGILDRVAASNGTVGELLQTEFGGSSCI
jgi:hypothetical protein